MIPQVSKKICSIFITLLVCLTVTFSTLLTPVFISPLSEASAQTVTERPFSEQGGCKSPPTTWDQKRRSCNDFFTWPDTEQERPNGNYSIIKSSVVVEQLDRRGTGGGCEPSYIEEEIVIDLPEIGPTIVSLVKGVKISFNARGSKNPNTTGRIECKVSGRYSSQ